MRPEGRTPITRLILLVDDDVRVRTLLADMLEMLDHRVEMADTGEEALTLLAARSYDVVLTDFQLPGIDGAEFYQRIDRRHRRGCRVPGGLPRDPPTGGVHRRPKLFRNHGPARGTSCARAVSRATV